VAKRLAKPAESVSVRLDWDREKVGELDAAAAFVGLSAASFARLAMELLIAHRTVTLDAVREAAIKATTKQAAPPPPAKPRGRPRKDATASTKPKRKSAE
jgi:hypothetical protein